MTTKQSTINLIQTIICDDIRREDNGKFLLIGVYPEIIMMSVLPVKFFISIWMKFKMHLLERMELEFELRGDALQETVPFTLGVGDKIIFGRDEMVPIIMKVGINVKDSGNFSIYYRKKQDKTWQLAETFAVQQSVPVTIN